VVLVRGHRPVTRWTISLADGQSWHRAPAVPARAALSVRLFRLPDTAVPYRSVTLAGHSAAAAP
jgi:hypothetical protein